MYFLYTKRFDDVMIYTHNTVNGFSFVVGISMFEVFGSNSEPRNEMRHERQDMSKYQNHEFKCQRTSRVARSLVFYVMLCRSLFILLSFFFLLLHCLSFDLRLLINHLVSSNLSHYPFIHNKMKMKPQYIIYFIAALYTFILFQLTYYHI